MIRRVLMMMTLISCGGIELPQDRCLDPDRKARAEECTRGAFAPHSGLCDLESYQAAAVCWPECSEERARLECLAACEAEWCRCAESAAPVSCDSTCEVGC